MAMGKPRGRQGNSTSRARTMSMFFSFKMYVVPFPARGSLDAIDSELRFWLQAGQSIEEQTTVQFAVKDQYAQKLASMPLPTYKLVRCGRLSNWITCRLASVRRSSVWWVRQRMTCKLCQGAWKLTGVQLWATGCALMKSQFGQMREQEAGTAPWYLERLELPRLCDEMLCRVVLRKDEMSQRRTVGYQNCTY